jgi:hypothetical protein
LSSDHSAAPKGTVEAGSANCCPHGEAIVKQFVKSRKVPRSNGIWRCFTGGRDENSFGYSDLLSAIAGEMLDSQWRKFLLVRYE